MDRDELEQGLRALHGETRMGQTMDLIDAYVDSLSTHSGDLGTCGDVAAELGLPSNAHARFLLSRWKLKKVGTREHPKSGRTQSLFDLQEVRAERDRRGWVYEERG